MMYNVTFQAIMADAYIGCVTVYHYKDGEERSEGPDAQCKGKQGLLNKGTLNMKTQRENKTGRPPLW